ncbi:MAG: hypothetical protein E7A72_08755 [Actinomyces urogenitalis]|uniref:Uncharacterized protein n=1 Tax=Actinomyces urogenitalis TaxID=103621 RepID=A0A2I1KQX4_9ACTO|nr:hypothetical protein [Actinomyces urogenitalis]MBS5977983.1 hypothetical protein [Actinomyces urogenitalis]MDU0972968.1 hypothetical protein [Actinomyces urogenitalis]PKY98022.1 hypothetical protein CYJ26_09440 [Actinomyces urogenitalis]
MTPADENPLTNQNLTFEVETAIEINKDSTYSGFTNTVVHHEFLITKTSASYTTMDGWVFDGAYNVDGYQSWLLNTKIKTVVIDDIPYVTLSGDQTVVDSNPGVSTNTLVITQARTGNKDEVTVKRTSWLVEDSEQSAKTSEVPQSVSGTVEGHYNLFNSTQDPEMMGSSSPVTTTQRQARSTPPSRHATLLGTVQPYMAAFTRFCPL